MFWFTSDEHYVHANIIKYSKRPFYTVEEMDRGLIERFNLKVKDDDTTIHCGDFTLRDANFAESIIRQLNGRHIFITGSHDKWMHRVNTNVGGKILSLPGYILEQMIEGTYIVACHYAMRVWPRSHYGSVQVYGHSHGNLPAIGRQMDVGVDTHYHYPISFAEVINVTNGEASPSPRV
jgi:calcineurin-like phosphoesterase family protein